MTEFLLIAEKISKYNKEDIDQGRTPLDVYKICSCLRNVFCLSYNIRKGNIFYIYIMNKDLMVKFDGKKLKYLGPDERSQSLLLIKALNISHQREYNNQDGWIKSTPGIFIKKLPHYKNPEDFYNSLPNEILITFSNKNNSIFDIMEISPNILKQLEDWLFIFNSDINSNANGILSYRLSQNKNILNFKLPTIEAIEDKILYINFQIDRFKEENNDPKER
ncbi:MAG: hypothetical protein EU531_07645, partial [Promethearchaeota archaeon]